MRNRWILPLLVFTLSLGVGMDAHAAVIVTDPAVYAHFTPYITGCCEHSALASSTLQAPRPFLLERIQLDNEDSSLNNHSWVGNIRAWIFDANDNVIASSTNTCYIQGWCNNVDLTFKGELIPATFIMRLILEDQLQGNANFTLSDIRFYENEPPREPIIIVPGIMGTRLNRVSDGEEVWPNAQEMIRIFNDRDAYLNELKLNTSGNTLTSISPGNVIEKELGQIVYENLINKFETANYTTKISLFITPYDWRLDLRKEISRLETTIQEALAKSPTGKVNIIAHSMGGLLVKQYLAEATSTDVINKLILLGSPQLGAPKVFKILNYGDNAGFNFGPINILNPERVKEISQNMPGVYELLPSRRYVSVNGGYIEDFRNTGPKTALNYDGINQFMTENPNDARNPTLIDLADQFHTNLDNQPINTSNIHNIVGCQNPTIGGFRIYDNGKVDLTMTNGDGTVPLTSAMNLANEYHNYFIRYDQTDVDHQGLVTNLPILDLVKNIIEENASSGLPNGVATSTSHCFTELSEFENETTISVSTHSPVTLHAYDSQNRHTGPRENGDVDLNIPKSSYETIGENSFIFVPSGDNYRFIADGLDTGSFDMKVKTYKGSNLNTAIAYLNVPLTSASTTAELIVTTNSPSSTLALDADGDSVFETTLEPVDLLAATSTNVVPPNIEPTTSKQENPPITIDVPASLPTLTPTSPQYAITQSVESFDSASQKPTIIPATESPNIQLNPTSTAPTSSPKNPSLSLSKNNMSPPPQKQAVVKTTITQPQETQSPPPPQPKNQQPSTNNRLANVRSSLSFLMDFFVSIPERLVVSISRWLYYK